MSLGLLSGCCQHSYYIPECYGCWHRAKTSMLTAGLGITVGQEFRPFDFSPPINKTLLLLEI